MKPEFFVMGQNFGLSKDFETACEQARDYLSKPDMRDTELWVVKIVRVRQFCRDIKIVETDID